MNNELPEGWVSGRINDLFEVNPPKPPDDALDFTANVSFVPMSAVDAKSGSIIGATDRPYSDVRKGYTSFANGDVILAKITPCFENGKAAVARALKNGL